MFFDKHLDAIRIRPTTPDPSLETDWTFKHLLPALKDAFELGLGAPLMTSQAPSAASRDPLAAPRVPVGATSRVPRPPNPFILYRQHHHHAVTAANPGKKNTEICELCMVHSDSTVLTYSARIIGGMWNNETPTIRARFRELAEEKKRLHSEAHPNYQYAPRRAGEKPRRCRVPRFCSEAVPLLKTTPAGQARVDDADRTTNGVVAIDQDCLNVLDSLGMIHGPNGFAPPPIIDNSRFNDSVSPLVDGHLELETVHYEDLKGDEFDETFPMDELLSLDGL